MVYSLNKTYPILKYPITYLKKDVRSIKRRYLGLNLKATDKYFYLAMSVEQLKSIDDLKLIIDSLETSPTSGYTEIKLGKLGLNKVMKSL